MNWLEIFGYIASITIVVSLLMTSIKKLRIINGIGAILFIIYAWLIGSFPAVLMNLGALIIDIVHLYRLYRVRTSFELIPVKQGEAYFSWFMNKHLDDIRLFDADQRFESAEQLFFYVRDNEVAGILAYSVIESGKVEVFLDYVTPKFRDCRIGRYFFGEKNAFFKEAGIHAFVTRTTNPKHESYLRQINFKEASEGVWTKSY